MDKFLKWIEGNKEHQALIDKSHKNVSTRENKAPLDECDNIELATYGDAVLKLALCEILWDKKTGVLTEEKKKYESDEVLVKYIAKRYDILQFLKFDKEDKEKPKDYEYTNHRNDRKGRKDRNNRNPYKYIATAIEACLGAMYMDKNVSWGDIIEIVEGWKNLINSSR